MTIQQKHRIQNSLKFIMVSAMERSSEKVREELFTVFVKWFDGHHRLVGDPVFYLLDCIFSLPLDLCEMCIRDRWSVLLKESVRLEIRSVNK